MWIMRWKDAIKLEKDLEIDIPNLRDKTQSTIKLLFAILNRLKKWELINLVRRNYEPDIELTCKRFERSNKPFDISEYMTNINALFKHTAIWYRLRKKYKLEEYELQENF
jgi:hypothetical protein